METTPQMDFAGLQARIVPLVAELFATLASQNPLRMYFADIAEKTLLDIVQVLREDGMSQEAIAATLGLTMNGYRAKMKRLHEVHAGAPQEPDEAPRTLLERVHTFVEETCPDQAWLGFEHITDKFKGVKPDSLKGVLHFLVRSDLLEVEGRGRTRRYRSVDRTRRTEVNHHDLEVLLYREGPLSLEEAARRLGIDAERCAAHLETVSAAGGVVVKHVGGEARYVVRQYHIPLDTVEGYEAAIFDHLAAVIHAICKKLRLGRHAASLAEHTGGATFSFRLPSEDPLWDEVSAYLRDSRLRLETWLSAARALPEEVERDKRVTIYVGQLTEEVRS